MMSGAKGVPLRHSASCLVLVRSANQLENHAGSCGNILVANYV